MNPKSPRKSLASHCRGAIHPVSHRRSTGPLGHRGVSEVIGFVLLFGVLILGLTIIQLYAVPTTNERLEFEHNQRALTDVNEVIDLLSQVTTTGTAGSTTIEAGMQYPSRLFLFNPPPVTGSFRSVPSESIDIANAAGVGEVADYWDGSSHSFETTRLSYTPNYNLYDTAPTRVIEHGLVYDRFESGTILPRNRLPLIEGRTVTVMTLEGSIDRATAGSIVVDIAPISVPKEAISVTNVTATDPITVTIPTSLSVADVETLLEEELVANGGYVTDVSSGPGNGVSIELEQGVTYDLRMAHLQIGDDAPVTQEHYLVPIADTLGTVAEGTNATMVVEVRDRFNNPISGVTVAAGTTGTGTAASIDSSISESGVTDFDGRVRLDYVAPGNVDGVPIATDTINVTMGKQSWLSGSSFDPRTLQNASIRLDVNNQDRSGIPGANDPGVGYGGTSQWSPTEDKHTFTLPNGKWTDLPDIQSIVLSEGDLVTRQVCGSGSSANPHTDCRYVDQLWASFMISNSVSTYSVDVELLGLNEDGDYTDSFKVRGVVWTERRHITVSDATGEPIDEFKLTSAAIQSLQDGGVDILNAGNYESANQNTLDLLKLGNDPTWHTGRMVGRVDIQVTGVP